MHKFSPVPSVSGLPQLPQLPLLIMRLSPVKNPRLGKPLLNLALKKVAQLLHRVRVIYILGSAKLVTLDAALPLVQI